MEKTWFITGSSSGIGLGIAKAVLAQGDNAVVMARSAAKLESLVQQYPQNALAVSLELTDRNSIRRAVQAAQDRFGSIDVLVNNAGHGYRVAVEEGEDEAVAELYGTNLFGPVELIKAVLPQMRERRSGAIINLSSIAAVQSGVGSGYCASNKAALELLSDALYQEVSPLGIKVMAVEPGAFRTRFFDDSLKETQVKIGDYAEISGKTRKENIQNLHDQPGDPDRGGKIIVETIQREDYPRILLLGSGAVQFVRDVLRKKLDEIEKWADVSARSDFFPICSTRHCG